MNFGEKPLWACFHGLSFSLARVTWHSTDPRRRRGPGSFLAAPTHRHCWLRKGLGAHCTERRCSCRPPAARPGPKRGAVVDFLVTTKTSSFPGISSPGCNLPGCQEMGEPQLTPRNRPALLRRRPTQLPPQQARAVPDTHSLLVSGIQGESTSLRCEWVMACECVFSLRQPGSRHMSPSSACPNLQQLLWGVWGTPLPCSLPSPDPVGFSSSLISPEKLSLISTPK